MFHGLSVSALLILLTSSAGCLATVAGRTESAPPADATDTRPKLLSKGLCIRHREARTTCDVVVFLTRYGEFSEKDWMLADYYRYRVRLPETKSSYP